MKRKTLRGLLLGVTPVLVVAAVSYVYTTGGRYVSTENAYVKAEIITVSANVDGQVVRVMARDNQRVEAGDLLFDLDPRPFETAIAAAEAELAHVRQKISSLRAHYREGQMEVAAAQERIRYLEIAHQRQQQLLAKGHGTQVRFDETEHSLAMARRRLAVVQENNAMVLADLGGNPDLQVERHPLFMKAEASLARATLDLDYASVSAPEDGTLSNVTLQTGEYVEAGDPLFALVTIDQPWIEANLKEVQLTHVRVGQSATVVVDRFPNVTWQARVESISPATGAEFAILPPQNATGNWVKVVQRIPVRLSLENPDLEHAQGLKAAEGSDLAAPLGVGQDLLRAGMTATVRIDTGEERKAAPVFGRVLAGPAEE